MEEYKQDIYEVMLTPEDTPMKLLYISGAHHVNQWKHEVNNGYCKLNLFMRGHSVIVISGASYSVGPGDILLYRPFDVHFGIIPYDQEIEYYELLFEPHTLARLSGGDELARHFSTYEGADERLFHPTAAVFASLSDKFALICNCLSSKGAHTNIEAIVHILSILVGMCGLHDFGVSAQPESGPYPKTLMDAIQFISKNYDRPITTDDIASAVFVSRSYLNRVFTKHISCSPHNYLLSVRLAKACGCLSSGMSVTEAALTSGFRDSASFAATFKRVCGVTPSHFRRDNGK